MANKEFNALASQSPISTDIFPFVYDPSGTHVAKKTSFADLVAAFKALGTDITTGTEDGKWVTPKAVKDANVTHSSSFTANYVPKFQDANTLINSLLYDNGNSVTVGYYASPTGRLELVNRTVQDYPTLSAEFLDEDNWTLGAGWSGDFATGFIHAGGGGTATLTHDHAATASTKYQIAYTVTGRTAGSFTLAFGGTSLAAISATGSFGPTATSTAALTITPTTDFNGTIVISIKAFSYATNSGLSIRSAAGTTMFEMRVHTSSTHLAIGQNAGRYATTALGLLALGTNALAFLTTATNDVALGHNAGAALTTGSYNTIVGNSAFQKSVEGSNNVAVGTTALYEMLSGHRNVAIGYNAGRTLTTGTNNTFLGYQAGYHASQKVDATNSMAIGNGAYTTADNQIVIGNTSITSILMTGALSITGSLGVNVASPTGKFEVQGVAANDLPTYSAEFLDSANWTLGAGWSGDFASGFAHSSGTATLTHDHAAVSTTKYQIAYTVTGRTAGSFTVAFGGQSLSGITATGAFGPTATDTSALTITPTTDFNGTIVISIKSMTAASSYLCIFRDSSANPVNAMRIASANANVLLGYNAGGYITTGQGNTSVGSYALNMTTTGYSNCAFGQQALRVNTTGYENAAFGKYAMLANVTGAGNTAIGTAALSVCVSGGANVAVGGYSLMNVTVGQNVGIGAGAGRTITTGTYNTFLGYAAGYNGSQKVDATNSMALGNGAYTTADNQVVIGNTSVTSTVLHGSITLDDAANLVLGTTTGTKIGTATSQKIGFFNATPVVQRSHIADATDATNVITRFNSLLLALEQLGLLASA